MAKSPVGGSRAYLKGRIGSDVYSLGKDGKGKRQQIVRALPESVTNPRTSSQMFGRMIMTTLAAAVHDLAPIIDHSFDGVPKGQPSISEFTRLNYALIKADAIAHPSAGNYFGLLKYQEKGIRNGCYIVSDGKIQKPAAVSAEGRVLTIALTETTMTVGGLKKALGLSSDGYLTLVAVHPEAGAMFARVHLSTSLADTTAISSENVASLFSIETNKAVTFQIASNSIYIALPSVETASEGSINGGVIVSEKVDGAWKHSTCVLDGQADYTSTADVALPTYPTGTEQFLNGGDL